MTRNPFLFKSAVLLAGLFVYWLAVAHSEQQGTSSRNPVRGSNLDGKQAFASSCSGCHGLDGMGTQRAPNIVSNPQARRLSSSELLHVISDGMPGTGMPAFQSLGQPVITSLVTYVRGLQGKNGEVPLAGDPGRGEALFFGAAQCSSCHMVSGKGGFVGPDLTGYGQEHSAKQIRSAIVNRFERSAVKSMVTAISKDGARYEGIIRNEDNFSLQLQSIDGAFHFLSKSDLSSVARAPDPIMPSDYSSRLTQSDLNDLVSYILSIGKTSGVSASDHDRDE